MEQKNPLIKIAVTGPESSGKTFTSEYLARVFDGWVVPEYARHYLDMLDRPYEERDLQNIAYGQIDVENKVTLQAIDEEVDIIFFDTDLVNTHIWFNEKYGECPDWIIRAISESSYDHYLLMRPDIDWEPDPLRENPADRERLFQMYIEYLNQYKKSYTIIQGGLEERLKLAQSVVRTFYL